MNFDVNEWKGLLALDDELEPNTRMLLVQYTMFLDSQGRTSTKPKVLAGLLNMPEKEVRKRLNEAREAEWLEAIDMDGQKGYRAVVPGS